MHILMVVVAGLVGLAVFYFGATLMGRPRATGAAIFIWVWLVASILNGAVGVFRAGIPADERDRRVHPDLRHPGRDRLVSGLSARPLSDGAFQGRPHRSRAGMSRHRRGAARGRLRACAAAGRRQRGRPDRSGARLRPPADVLHAGHRARDRGGRKAQGHRQIRRRHRRDRHSGRDRARHSGGERAGICRGDGRRRRVRADDRARQEADADRPRDGRERLGVADAAMARARSCRPHARDRRHRQDRPQHGAHGRRASACG